jgi:hypothetical protein
MSALGRTASGSGSCLASLAVLALQPRWICNPELLPSSGPSAPAVARIKSVFVSMNVFGIRVASLVWGWRAYISAAFC